MSRVQVAIAGSLLVVVTTLTVSLAVGAAPSARAEVQRAPAEAREARSVTSEFFRTLNQLRYGRTCELLATAYYERNRVPNKRHCAMGLRVGFMSPRIFVRITGVSVEGDRAVVRATANGAPGIITLVKEEGRFKILSMESRQR